MHLGQDVEYKTSEAKIINVFYDFKQKLQISDCPKYDTSIITNKLDK